MTDQPLFTPNLDSIISQQLAPLIILYLPAMTKDGHYSLSGWLLCRTVITACVGNFIEERFIPSVPSHYLYISRGECTGRKTIISIRIIKYWGTGLISLIMEVKWPQIKDKEGGEYMEVTVSDSFQ